MNNDDVPGIVASTVGTATIAAALFVWAHYAVFAKEGPTAQSSQMLLSDM